MVGLDILDKYFIEEVVLERDGLLLTDFLPRDGPDTPLWLLGRVMINDLVV